MTLSKIDATLKTLAGVCAVLAGSSYAGFIPPVAAIVIGFAAGLFAFLAGSPMLDPTLVGNTPWLSRACLTVAGLCTAAAGSSFFPSVQRLFSDGHAQKLATGLTMLGALCTFLSQSPILAGGTKPGGANGGPFPPDVTRTLALLLGLSLFGVSGCATVQPIVKDVEVCAGPDCADIATKILPAAELVLECELSTGGAVLPACATSGLAALAAAAGPDGWRIVGCIVNAIEKDATKPPAVRARARLARSLAAQKANGR